ncbi:flavin reductase like domain-containing protein [Auriculariales sp. MPI-PUGE-AT-0066]|nr:flavin reductase like domain-containing protein [Auriculariales sp. MPI-PUGE-AT-0066]
MEPMPMVTFAMRTPSRVVESIEEIGSQFNINLLAAHQASVAEKFARPDLHPDPWSEELKFDLDERGIPVFPGSLGWLKCHTEGVMAMGEENGSSLLLLGQVDGVQHGEHDALPLVYHRRAYTSVQSVHIPGSPYNSS